MKSKFALFLSVSLLLAFSASSVLAQGFTLEGGSLPSLVSTDAFVSLEGKFSIALPKAPHGFRPLNMDTPLGPARGDAYNWRMKQGSFIAGYVNLARVSDDPGSSAKIFDAIRDALVVFANSKDGKLSLEKRTDLQKHPALELKFDLPAGLFFQRFYLVLDRLYEVALLLETPQRPDEAVALMALDTFKILADDEVAVLLKAQAAAAEPSPLPQEPVPPRVGSDAADDGLRGNVKTVLQESEDLSGTWSVQGRKRNSMEYFNKRGDLTRQEQYDYRGNLKDITVYGYLDGARVADRKIIEQSYNPVIAVAHPGGAKPKYDPRYSNKFTFKYDQQKRLLEKVWWMNDGELWLKYVYKYSPKQVEALVYAADGSLNRRYLSTLDEKGNEMEETSFDTRSGSIQDKYSYAYEFDDHGNWIKKTTSKWVTKDGRSFYQPSHLSYRAIVYY